MTSLGPITLPYSTSHTQLYISYKYGAVPLGPLVDITYFICF